MPWDDPELLKVISRPQHGTLKEIRSLLLLFALPVVLQP